MLMAHLPSGYDAGRLAPEGVPAAMPVALVASVLPDVDMLWFNFVDHGRVHHHLYWTHVPAFWAALALPVLALLWGTRWRGTAILFFAVIALHPLMDTVGGGIVWFWPFSDRLVTLVEVPATQSHWVLSFLLHWTFLLELAIWGAAIWLWRAR